MQNYKRAVFLLFFLINITAFSHPHIFIENSVTFIFNEDGLEGLRIKWIFDEMFSASLILDFDSNTNNLFEKNEIKVIELDAFSNLENYNYFLHISIDDTIQKIPAVTDFNAEIKDNRTIYSFFVPLNFKANSTEKTITVGCYDETYYCALSYSAAPAKLEKDSGFDCVWKMVKDKKRAYWGETIIPEVISCGFRKKNA